MEKWRGCEEGSAFLQPGRIMTQGVNHWPGALLHLQTFLAMTSSVGTPYALFPHRVLAIEAVTPQVYVLDLEKRFPFLPGQVVL